MTASYSSLLNRTTSTGVFSWRGAAGRDLVGEAETAGWNVLRLDSTAIVSVRAAGFGALPPARHQPGAENVARQMPTSIAGREEVKRVIIG